MADLVELMATGASAPNTRRMAASSPPVAHAGGGGVRVQVLHVLRREARLCQRGPHAARGAVTVFGAGGDVVRVGRRAVAHQLGQRLRAPRQRMVQRLDHQHARTLAHHKAVALRIEWA